MTGHPTTEVPGRPLHRSDRRQLRVLVRGPDDAVPPRDRYAVADLPDVPVGRITVDERLTIVDLPHRVTLSLCVYLPRGIRVVTEALDVPVGAPPTVVDRSSAASTPSPSRAQTVHTRAVPSLAAERAHETAGFRMRRRPTGRHRVVVMPPARCGRPACVRCRRTSGRRRSPVAPQRRSARARDAPGKGR